MSQFNRSFDAMWYLLKQQYACDVPVDVYQRVSAGVDLKTGASTQELTKVSLCDCIVLPANVFSKFIQNISKIQADRNFVWGGTYPVSSRAFLVDPDDLDGLQLTEQDWIVYENRKYEILKFTDFEIDEAYIIADAVHGDLPQQIFDVCVEDNLRFQENSDAP